jgi:hypothetical protein
MDFWHNPWLAKVVGTIIGVGISMVMISPKSVRNGIYRAFVSTVMGLVFTPATQNLLPWLGGDEPDIIVAAACTAGFSVWFVLEAGARFLSSRETLRRLLEEMVRLGPPEK